MIFPITTTEDFSGFMEDLRCNGSQLQEDEPRKTYYVQAFIGKEPQWDEWALDEEERDVLVKQAIDAWFSFIVETEVE